MMRASSASSASVRGTWALPDPERPPSPLANPWLAPLRAERDRALEGHNYHHVTRHLAALSGEPDTQRLDLKRPNLEARHVARELGRRGWELEN
jgi:hypothetical protein